MASLIDKSSNTFTYSLTSTGTTNWIVLDTNLNPFEVGVFVDLADTPNLEYRVEVTGTLPASLSDASVPAFPLSNMTDLTSSDAKGIDVPVAAVRLNVTAYTQGTARITVVQSGNRNTGTGR